VPKQLVRKIHGWRFEVPLAIGLGGAAGFAASVMPTELFQRVPLVSDFGMVGQGALALALGLGFGWSGYAVMRRPSAPVAEPEAEDETLAEEVSDRLRRFRRADFHPDAPPRAPIRALRDLGEPMMEVGADTFAWSAVLRPLPEDAVDTAIPEGDFIDVSGQSFVDPAAPAQEAEADVVETPASARAVFEARAEPSEPSAFEAMLVEPIAPSDDLPRVERDEPAMHPFIAAPPRSPARIERQSLEAMMDRLSAGLERRVREAGRTAPPLSPDDSPRAPLRDMRPALRDALEELNRLAARRG
jgi:hypothetical protein